MKRRVSNTGEFVDLVRAVNIPHTDCWLNKLQSGYPQASWETFRNQPLTMAAVNSLIDGVTTQAGKQVEDSRGKGMECYYALCVRWRGFVDEIRALAKECFTA